MTTTKEEEEKAPTGAVTITWSKPNIPAPCMICGREAELCCPLTFCVFCKTSPQADKIRAWHKEAMKKKKMNRSEMTMEEKKKKEEAPQMIGGKRIPIMVRIHGPMKVNEDALGNVFCNLHDEQQQTPKNHLGFDDDGNYAMLLGEPYYDVTFGIAEGEWIGSSFSLCEKCLPKFLAESEATKAEILLNARQI